MASTTTNAVSQKVASWIDLEHRCVTTQRICQQQNLSRKEASSLLEELYDATKHQAIVCLVDKTEQDGVPTTVFRLQKAKGEVSNIVAVASLQATESIATAHERDLVEWREMVADGRLEQPLAIDPSDAMDTLQDTPAITNRSTTTTTTGVESKAKPSTLSSNIGNSNGHHKKVPVATTTTTTKVTTAASFFGSKSKTAATTTTKTAAPTDTKPPQPTKAKENKVRTNQVAPNPPPSSKAQKVGNADDFVGDKEDSDDDDDDDENGKDKKKQEQRRQQAARRKAVQEANLADQELDIELQDKDEEIKVVGAMDAFATSAPKPPPKPSTSSSTRQRKRRKKLVEETVMVNGYLRTETKAIWEDVPTDEEEEEVKSQPPTRQQQFLPQPSKKSTTNQSTAKTQQGMKQKSLMGFFTKK